MAKKPPTDFYRIDKRKNAGKPPPPEVQIALEAARREALDPEEIEKRMRAAKLAKTRELVDKKTSQSLAILRRWLTER
jgi:flagellar biosynthesis/type III secretory pathway M-ring protein FliF/YscJ